MQASFKAGAKEGFRAFLPQSVGLMPWALVTGVAMVSAGFTPVQAMAMNIIVFAGTAQLGTLPLIIADAPVWIIVATALLLNLRFMIFSAAIARGFRGISTPARWLAGYGLTDSTFALTLNKMLTVEDRHWRLGYFLAPALWLWVLWQAFALVGVLGAGSIPKTWSLEFMATIALLVLLVPIAKSRPMLVAALTSGAMAMVLRGLPLRLGMFAAIICGIGAGFAAEYWEARKEKA
jgi:predicted branched-subunit amino acid permease